MRFLILVLFLMLTTKASIAQCFDPDSKYVYYMPTHWAGETFTGYNGNEMLQIYTSFPTASVNIYNADGSFTNSLNLTQDNVVVLQLSENTSTNSAETNDHNQIISNRGFIFESDFPINLFYLIDGFNNRSLVRLKGETVLGTSFITATKPLSDVAAFGVTSGAARETHYVSVIATEGNTEVCFQKNGYIIEGNLDDATSNNDIDITNPLCVTLPNKGDTYMIRAQTGCAGCAMNGIQVTSDKNITLNSGTIHIKSPASGCKDGGIEQLPPTSIGGSEFAIVRGDLSANNEYFWVNALEPNTQVFVDGVLETTLTNVGDTYVKVINGTRGTPYYINTSKDVQVYHASGTSGCEIGFSFVPEINACAGTNLVPFSRIGNDDNILSLSIPTAGIFSLTYNGMDVNTTNFPTLQINNIPGTTPPYSAVSIGNADVLPTGVVAFIESDENFQLAVQAGNAGGGGLFNYLTSPFYSYQIDNADEPLGIDSRTFAFDCIEIGESDTLNLSIESCADGANSFSVADNIGNVSFMDDSIIYMATENGIDDFRVLVVDGNGISKTIFLQACIGDKDNDQVQDDVDVDVDNDGILNTNEGVFSLEESFEMPVYPVINGNNIIGSTFGSFETTNGSNLNIIHVDETVYTVGPNMAQDGNQYIDIISANDYLSYEFTLTEYCNSVKASVWLSNRSETSATYTPWSSQIELIEVATGNVVIAGNTLDFDETASQEEWFETKFETNAVSNGDYIIRFYLDDYGHADNVKIRLSEDKDCDGVPNGNDLDSDNDGIPDAIEACGDINLMLENCMIDSDGSDVYPDFNEDGCADGLSNDACMIAPIDTDNDDIPDFLDLDSDNDACPDAVEACTITNSKVNKIGYASLSNDVDECGVLFMEGSTSEPECFMIGNEDYRLSSEAGGEITLISCIPDIMGVDCYLEAPSGPSSIGAFSLLGGAWEHSCSPVSEFTYSYNDSIPSLCGDEGKIVYRIHSVMDACGNVGTCVQQIFYQRPIPGVDINIIKCN